MMLTRCPGCTTTFRVTPEQVKARHGKVRCGRCQHVFDAIEHLVEADIATPLAAPLVEQPAQVIETVLVLPQTPVDDMDTDTLDQPTQPSAETLLTPEPDTVDAEPALAPAGTDDVLLQPSPLSTNYGPRQASARTSAWPWVIASLLVFAALLGQYLLAFRVELAVKYPAVRPVLEMLCAQTGCTIELPSNPELVSIEASDLHPGKKGGLELIATLRNRAPHAQAWPHLELTLTDGADKPIVRKVITPAQYLPGHLTEADGFEANGELAVQLQLDPGNLPAAGYRLYLFYP